MRPNIHRRVQGARRRERNRSSESSKYRPLCNILNTVESIAGSNHRWKIVANLGESSEIDHHPDLARYPTDIKEAKAAYRRNVRQPAFSNIARCAWAWMTSLIDVKNSEEVTGFYFSLVPDENGGIPFLRDTEQAKIARAQFIKYATEALLRQHRTHYYSFYIAGMAVRVFRWDRVGCLVSEPIDLAADHETFLDILHRLATAEDDYGADDTVVLATSADIDPVREFKTTNDDLWDYKEMMLNDLESYPIYKVTCPTVDLNAPDTGAANAATGERTYLIGRHAFGHDTVFGRCTRGYAAWDVTERRFVWLKDQWRCGAHTHTELDAYMRLHAHGVPYIATPVAGGDVPGQRTRTQARRAEESRPAQRVHTRLVTREAGRLLETYRDSVELLHICTMAFVAHKHAWERAKVLHGDISVGNIMINCETGNGFLNDWDLCKYREDIEDEHAASEPPRVSGTWAFKSALALRYPRKPPELADDLESFVHVITFLGWRFHHHELSPQPVNDTEDARIQANADNNDLTALVGAFFYQQQRAGAGFYTGGTLKYRAILDGKLLIPFKRLPNGHNPMIDTFLTQAYRLLQEHYWSLDMSAYEKYAVAASDRADPDESDRPLLKEPPETLAATAPLAGDHPAYHCCAMSSQGTSKPNICPSSVPSHAHRRHARSRTRSRCSPATRRSRSSSCGSCATPPGAASSSRRSAATSAGTSSSTRAWCATCAAEAACAAFPRTLTRRPRSANAGPTTLRKMLGCHRRRDRRMCVRALERQTRPRVREAQPARATRRRAVRARRRRRRSKLRCLCLREGPRGWRRRRDLHGRAGRTRNTVFSRTAAVADSKRKKHERDDASFLEAVLSWVEIPTGAVRMTA
ncbi:hypothetical protein PsYK624_026690 [Phanerochaete sordida]|uniref:Fungal-type protein kinase domain-containing protein n=1 Tax=Phanerochaete sordida TaxID=48140 RepID=A0A9P3L9J3_9APHY|nr:hypothetical protein PsYK624_026690 [Phanerochaete sordida]